MFKNHTESRIIVNTELRAMNILHKITSADIGPGWDCNHH